MGAALHQPGLVQEPAQLAPTPHVQPESAESPAELAPTPLAHVEGGRASARTDLADAQSTRPN
ncbi:hypothetical protein ACQB6R_11240 [Propionibacteriaceae bacterium G1746]|uniref:hypothetical protein n=1 Tax=Aestuariimicrobium sp. G57 TaxID=3418485 RepID=UPI003C1C7B80